MRGYTVDYGDEGTEFVVADSAKEAKKIAWNNSEWLRDVGDFIELRVKWRRLGNIKGLKKGLYDDWLDLLKRGFFDSVYGVDCPSCGITNTCCWIDEHGCVVCNICIDLGEGK